MVVFLDGVDGTGKTTLMHRLAENIPDHHAYVAPPLWRYLPSVVRPEVFADWVITTEPTDVAVELLTAQLNRIDEIWSKVVSAKILTVLVDRGPKTVEASARAHLGADDIIERLSDDERHNAAYLRYLHAFLREFHAGQDIEGVQRLVLNATDPLRQITAAASQAVRDAQQN